MKAKISNANAASSAFNFDPDLLREEHNEARLQRVPFAIVINQDDAGLFIPEKCCNIAGWKNPEYVDLKVIKTQPQKDRGVFLTSAKMLVLGSVAPYIRYKNTDETKEVAGQFIGWYQFNKAIFDKQKMEVCGEYLVMFLDENLEFLHEKPFGIRFRNSSYWKFKIALDEIYETSEASFAQLAGVPRSAKSDKWRSLVVIDLEFEGQLVGKGSNQNYACGIKEYVNPDVENFPGLFLGSSEQVNRVWSLVGAYQNFSRVLASQQEAIALSSQSEPKRISAANVEVLDDDFPY